VSPCADGVPRCPDDRCSGGRCSIVYLASAGGAVFGVDQDYVYWANEREIDRIPKCGGAKEVLVLSQNAIKDARLHGDAIYFRYDTEPDRIYRQSTAGGLSEELVVDPELMIYQAQSLTLAGEHAYLGYSGGVVALPLAGGFGTQAFSGSQVGAPATDGERAYFYSPYPAAGFFVLDGMTSSSFSSFVAPSASPLVSASASDGEALYVALAPYNPVTLYRVDADGGTQMTQLDARPETVRVDDRCVYVSTPEGKMSGIRRLPKDSDVLETVASAGVPFVMDETSLFFISSGLYRLPK